MTQREISGALMAAALREMAEEIKTANYQDKGAEKAHAAHCLSRLLELKKQYDASLPEGE